ncbi:hypothetical protein RB25_04780 [Herbaspirillum rubrisubalbicans]|nr:hypothetical protein RB25_04780 [Herbaspirillum rubrisubalbicans]
MKSIFVRAFFVVLLSACSPSHQEHVPMSSLAVSINVSPEKLLREHGDQIKVVKQGPGINFYTAQWTQQSPGSVTIQPGKFQFTIPYVLGLQGVEESRAPAEGVVQYEVFAGITGPDLIGHDEARQKFFALLQGIRKAGWAPFIDRDDPRIRGRQRLEYVLKSSSASSLDPDYEPTLAEWMQLEDLSRWTFYADHAYLSVAFKREASLRDPDKPGAYLLTYTLMSENQHFRTYVAPQERDRWKELLPATLKTLQAQRQQAEKEWRLKGASIDEGYVDPRVPQL